MLLAIGYDMRPYCNGAMMTDNNRNRLANESSPYLLQHADNPVDWFPWGEEALELARTSGKPILLSIGYSACHWCHVMAHESFEDEAIAQLMNETFVNIKVDREERPDIDKIYQTSLQLLTQQPGGWPLTMFINPANQRPFFGGTYFPNEPRHGMPSFPDLIARVAGYFHENPVDVKAQGEQLTEIFGRMEPEAAEGEVALTEEPLLTASEKIPGDFDREYGGIGSAPKFPHATTLDRMLRQWRGTANGANPDVEALFLVSLSLARMAEGGIYDHLAGGFCRYSVDRYWQIPHFEKMLYDNGPLLALYAQAHIATGEALFARVANETADWILADMRSPAGGLFSSRDADSEGEEGLFYVWVPEDVKKLIPDEDYAAFSRYFGLNKDANFEGKWHLAVSESLGEIAKDVGSNEDDLRERMNAARKILFAEREKRVAPGRDDKQLTSWNALAIRGLAVAGRSLSRPDLSDAASEAATFLHDNVLRDGRLLASHKDGVSKFAAYLDDHAFLLDALLELLQAQWNTQHLNFAVTLADLLLEHFYDEESGGFYFTADDHEKLMHRPKTLADEAIPSGNGVAAYALQRLGFLLGETRYLDAAEKTLKYAWKAMLDFPHGHVSLLTALEEYLHHPEMIIIRGDVDEINRWRDSAAKLYSPRRLVFAIGADVEGLPGALAERKPIDDQTVAYRCVGSHCSLPLTSWESLAAEISESPPA
jgi:uncharacterized protein YyaL (SSP411 family)